MNAIENFNINSCFFKISDLFRNFCIPVYGNVHRIEPLFFLFFTNIP